VAFRNHSLCIFSHGRYGYNQAVATWMRVDHCGVLSIGPINSQRRVRNHVDGPLIPLPRLFPAIHKVSQVPEFRHDIT
jgi:hypothetical protein